MADNLFPVLVSLLFLGGVFGVGSGFLKFLDGGTPAEYGVLGIGGACFLLFSAIVLLIRGRAEQR